MKDFDRKAVGDLLSDPDTTATALLVIVLRAYGDAVFGDEEQGIPPMDPLELWQNLKDDFHAQTCEENENRLNAIMLALSSDAFYDDVEAFTAISSSLEDGDLGDTVTGELEQLTVPEILWAIYEVELNRDDKQDFVPGIIALIERTMAAEADDLEDSINTTPMAYWENFLSNKRAQLMEELRILGVDEKMISSLKMHDLTPAHDPQGNYTPDGI